MNPALVNGTRASVPKERLTEYRGERGKQPCQPLQLGAESSQLE